MHQSKKRVSLRKSDAKRKSTRKVDAIKANIAQMTNEKKLVNVSSQSKVFKGLMNADEKAPIVVLPKFNNTFTINSKAKHETGYDIYFCYDFNDLS
jgi:hypothetical protein